MKAVEVIALLLVVTGALAACEPAIEDIEIGPACDDLLPAKEAELYVQEDYCVCGTLTVNGTPFTGVVSVSEESILPAQEASIRNGRFCLEGKATTEKQGLYAVLVSVPEPCNETTAIPVQVRGKCILTPLTPTNLQVLPKNAVEEGEDFTIEVKNFDRDFNLTLSGLSTPVSDSLKAGTVWSRTFQSSQCCAKPPCSCRLSFSLVDAKHSLCHYDTSIDVRVTEPVEEIIPPQIDSGLLVLLLILIFVGTIAAVLINRK